METDSITILAAQLEEINLQSCSFQPSTLINTRHLANTGTSVEGDGNVKCDHSQHDEVSKSIRLEFVS